MKTHLLEQDYLNLLQHFRLDLPKKGSSFEERYQIIQSRITGTAGHPRDENAKSWSDLINTLFLDENLTIEDKVSLLSNRIENSSPLTGNAQFITGLLSGKKIVLSEAIYFNIFPTGEFNAGAYRTPNGMMCLLNTGILKLIYSITYNCFYLLSEKSVTNREERKREVAGYVIKIIHDFLIQGKLSPIFINQYELDKDAAMDVLSMNIAIRNFIVAHEVGHLVLKHTEAGHRPLMMVGEKKLSIIKRSHEKEFEADLFAQELLLYSDQEQRLSIPMVGGGIAFFLVYLMIHNVKAKLAGDPTLYRQASESHPSAFERIRQLDNYLGPRLPTKRSRSGIANCTILQQILLTIEQIEIKTDR